jgi:hypothetical protein
LIGGAIRDDVPDIMAIRADVREKNNAIPRSSQLKTLLVRRKPRRLCWVENSKIVGFSAADPCNGSVFALFVRRPVKGGGIGQALFKRAIEVLNDASCPRMWLTTWPGTSRAVQPSGGIAGHRHQGWGLGVRTGGTDGQVICNAWAQAHSTNVRAPMQVRAVGDPRRKPVVDDRPALKRQPKSPGCQVRASDT